VLAGTLVAPAQAVERPPGDGAVVGPAADGGGGVVTMVPERIVSDLAVAPGTVRCLSVAGAHGIPDDAVGVILNVTTVRPDGAGHAVVFPDTSGNGTTAPPATSTVNFEPGKDVAASTFMRLGPNGDLCYATRGATRAGVLMDVSGYVEEGSGVVLAAPQRLLDTRENGRVGMLPPRSTRSLQVGGKLGVPEDAEAAILNVTVTGVESVGHLRMHPGGLPFVPEEAGVVNYAPFVDKANATVARLSNERVPGIPAGRNGWVELYSDTDRPVHVIVDVLGWTTSGGRYVASGPSRVVDTREDPAEGENAPAPVESGVVHTLNFTEEGDVPPEATAVVLNVTAIHPSTDGNLRVYPSDPEADPPDASSVNYIPGRDIPNLLVVGLSPDGSVDVYSDQPDGGTVHLAVDLLGYVAP